MLQKLPLLLLFFSVLFNFSSQAQVNGVVLSDNDQVKIIKVWGDHAERGYAYGYLEGADISQLFNNYLKPSFGAYYNYARGIITSGSNLRFDSVYVVEAKAIVQGMDSAGTNTASMDYVDILVSNSFLDLSAIMSAKDMGMGCSSLVSWNSATDNTNLNGAAVLTRHLDWTPSTYLTENQHLVIHQPSDPGEQNFAIIGFAGMMSVLSGFNNHTAAFQHMMDDFSGSASVGMNYEPVWLSLRKALEVDDLNQDGTNDVQDIRSALNINPQGYAGAYIISSVASSTGGEDSLIAMIAEICPVDPKLTYRYSSFEDSIPGDNIYTANYQIGRNNALHFCSRYTSVMGAIGDGTGYGIDEHWALMRDYSHLTHNIQLMQFAPELDHFRIAAYGNGTPAYENSYIDFSVNDLLNTEVSISEIDESLLRLKVYPNPAGDYVTIAGLETLRGDYQISIMDYKGSVAKIRTKKNSSDRVYIGNLKPGVYFIHIKFEGKSRTLSIVKS